MQVTIKGEPKEIFVQTITLQPEETDNLYGFHCLTCGNFHQKIGGKVSKIYPVYEPSDQVPVVSRCRHCNSEYTFQTYDGYSSDEIRVILHPKTPTEDEPRSYFYCYKGKDLILEYTKDTIISLIDNKTKNIPFKASCPNGDCDIHYLFTDMF